jgi:hypothetical protein
MLSFRSADWLWAGRQRNRGSVPDTVKIFFLLHVIQIGSGGPPSLLSNRYLGHSPVTNRPERESDHSRLTSAEVESMWVYTLTSPYAFMT